MMALQGMNLGTMVVNLAANTTNFESRIKTAEAQISGMQKKLTAITKKVTFIAGAAFSAFTAKAIHSFAKFDDAMTQSVAIMTGVNQSIRREMEETARTISKSSITSAEDLAKSYYYLASAGLDARQSIAALATVEKFAVAGAFDMSQATDLLTDAQSALGLTVKDSTKNMENMTRISDVLVRANTLANASVEQFSRALTTKAAASLRLLNKDIEEGVAILAAFADQGIKGELAGERFSIVMRDLQKAALTNESAWRKLGLQVYDVSGKMLPIVSVVEQLETSFSTMSDQQKKSTAEMLGFQDRSFSALQSLLGTSEKIREYERQLRIAGGTTEDVAQKQLTSFSSQMKNMWNIISEVAITLGEKMAPHLKNFANLLIQIIKGFQGNIDVTSKYAKLAERIVDVAKAIYRAFKNMIMVGIVLYLTKLVHTVYILTKAFTSLKAVSTGAIFGPLTIALSGLLTLFDSLVDSMNEIPESARKIRSSLDEIKNSYQGLEDVLMELGIAQTRGDLKTQAELYDQLSNKVDEYILKFTKLRKEGITGVQFTPKYEKVFGGLGYKNKEEMFKEFGRMEKFVNKDWINNILGGGEEVYKSMIDIDKLLESLEYKRQAFIIARNLRSKEEVGILEEQTEEIEKANKTYQNQLNKKWEAIDAVYAMIEAAKDEETVLRQTNQSHEIAVKILEAQKKLYETGVGVEYADEMIQSLEEQLTLNEKITEEIETQREEQQKALERLQQVGQYTGEIFARAFEDAILKARKLQDILTALAQDVARLIIRQTITGPLAEGITGIIKSMGSASSSTGSGAVLSSLTGGLSGGLLKGSALGNLFHNGSIVPFASGGFIKQPTLFPMTNNQIGIAGEADDEVIMPVGRDDKGRMGVKAEGRVINQYITFNTPNSDSFRQSIPQTKKAFKKFLGR